MLTSANVTEVSLIIILSLLTGVLLVDCMLLVYVLRSQKRDKNSLFKWPKPTGHAPKPKSSTPSPK